jgi:nicotinate dehydrogenase subunit B
VTAEALPPSLAANPRLGDWVRIGSDGIVEIRSGKVELGQGVITALAQVAAEELDVEVARVEMTAATTDLSPDEGLTAGSLSIQLSGAAIRQVCAEVRDMFIGIAADKLAVPKEELTIEDGQISAPDGATTSYWELADDTLLDRVASGDAAPKPVSEYRVVGTSIARLDLPDKIAGRPRYVHDLTMDGMAYGRVVRPRSRGATLRDIDTGPTEDLPGVIAVMRDGSFLAVVAEHEETALRAADLLRRDAVWEQRPTLPDENALPAFLTSAPTDTTVIADVGQRPRSGVARSTTESYHRPYLAHGSIGPSCAVALAAHDHLEIWTLGASVRPTRPRGAGTCCSSVELGVMDAHRRHRARNRICALQEFERLLRGRRRSRGGSGGPRATADHCRRRGTGHQPRRSRQPNRRRRHPVHQLGGEGAGTVRPVHGHQ